MLAIHPDPCDAIKIFDVQTELLDILQQKGWVGPGVSVYFLQISQAMAYWCDHVSLNIDDLSK